MGGVGHRGEGVARRDGDGRVGLDHVDPRHPRRARTTPRPAGPRRHHRLHDPLRRRARPTICVGCGSPASHAPTTRGGSGRPRPSRRPPGTLFVRSYERASGCTRRCSLAVTSARCHAPDRHVRGQDRSASSRSSSRPSWRSLGGRSRERRGPTDPPPPTRERPRRRRGQRSSSSAIPTEPCALDGVDLSIAATANASPSSDRTVRASRRWCCTSTASTRRPAAASPSTASRSTGQHARDPSPGRHRVPGSRRPAVHADRARRRGVRAGEPRAQGR